MQERKLRAGFVIRLAAALLCTVGLVWSNLTLYMNAGNIAGTALFGAGLALALFWEGAVRLAGRLWRRIAGRVLLCALGAVCAGGIFAAAFFSVNMAYYASQKTEQSDCVIVLGCQVVGEIPSYMLQDRLETALALLERSPQAVCIVSGEQGARESVTEAEAMRRWLTERGVDGARIIKEEQSASTRENLRGCARIINERGINGDVTIVTSEFHQYRAELYAREVGLDVGHESARTSTRLILNSWLREWVGLLQFYAHVT